MTLDRLNAVADNLRCWMQARAACNQKPRRRGRPLDNAGLADAVSLLEEYRGVLNRIDTALTVFEKRPEVVAFIESLRDGYPLQVGALNNALAKPSAGWGQ